MSLKFKLQSSSAIPDPTFGQAVFFIDSEGIPRIKDSDGVLTTLTKSGASFLTGDSAITPQANGVYVCTSPATISLPEVGSNGGLRITVTFSTRGSSVTVVNPANTSLIDVTGQQRYVLNNLRSGTYEFHAASPLGDSAGLWIVKRLSSTDSRNVTDVDLCMPGVLPGEIGSTITVIPNANDSSVYTLEGTGTLPFDGYGDTSEYAPGDTVLIPFDPQAPGYYLVLEPPSPGTWKLQSLENVQLAPGNNVDSEFRILKGGIYADRVFLSNTLRAAPPFYTLNNAAPSVPSSTTSITHGGTILVGRINLLDLTAGVDELGVLVSEYTLKIPEGTGIDLTGIGGERFSIKVASGGAAVATAVNISCTAQSFEVPFGDYSVVSSPMGFNIGKGGFVEWELFPDGIWYVVTAIVGKVS